jgi:hypothetical protein
MDIKLLWISLGLIIGGFVVSVIGTWIDARGRAAATNPTLLELIARAFGNMSRFLLEALSPNRSLGLRIASLGSVIALMGLITFGIFVITALGSQGSTTPQASPAPTST